MRYDSYGVKSLIKDEHISHSIDLYSKGENNKVQHNIREARRHLPAKFLYYIYSVL